MNKEQYDSLQEAGVTPLRIGSDDSKEVERLRAALKKARTWIADDLNAHFHNDGERRDSSADIDLTKQTDLVNEIDAILNRN